MLRNLAPVILFTYNRPDHTKKVLDALSNNYLAADSVLYIFCDGPKNEKAIKNNQLTQQVIIEESKKNRFKNVYLTISERNKGLANSIITGVSAIIQEYGACVVLEDDHITSEYFLTYMNNALEYYRDNQKIWSISGFTYPLKSLEKYPHDVYMSYRANSHGWGTWLDRWTSVDWEVSDFLELSRSFKRIRQFNRGGNDLYRMLRHQVRGERDSWAIRFCYSQSKQNKLTVYPRTSLIKNIGFDGSGTHCQAINKMIESDTLSEISDIKLEDITLDNRIVREFKDMYRVRFGEALDWLYRKAQKAIERRE